VKAVADTWRQGWTITLVLYGALFAWLFLGPAPRRRSERPPPTLVRIAPAPAAVPEPARPASPPPSRREAARRTEAARAAPSPPAPLLEAPPPPAAAPPRRFSVSMEATVPGGGVALPVASAGGPANPRGVPGATAEGTSEGPAGVEPDRGPSLVDQPAAAEMRALYPEAARRSGLEGDVRLELLVSETGEVVEATVVRPAGGGFDEVAQRLVRRFRFRPATRGGRPVPARIPWTYKFRLDG
jgi:protein TonB